MDKFDYFKQVVDETDPRHEVDIRRLQYMLQEAEDRYVKDSNECVDSNS